MEDKVNEHVAEEVEPKKKAKTNVFSLTPQEVNPNVSAKDSEKDNENTNKDFIQEMIQREKEEQKKKSKNIKFKGYYLEKKVADKIDELRKQAGRDSGSRMVNRILKEYLIENGYLK